MRAIRFGLASLMMLAAWPALAQDAGGENPPEPKGMAVAQAPEAGIGICFGTSMAETTQCAQTECMAQSGLGKDDCAVNLWSYPLFWSAQISILQKDGPSWSEFLTDWSSREQLEKAVELKCRNPDFAECLAVQIWDWRGEPQLAE